MRPPVVIISDPARHAGSSVSEIDEQRLVQELVGHAAVKALDEAVLHRPAGRDVVPADTARAGPGEDRVRGKLVPLSDMITFGCPRR
jgi:hypothetical protein